MPPSAAPAPQSEAAPAEAAIFHPGPDLEPVTLRLPPDSELVLVETTHRAEPQPQDEPMPEPRRARRPRAVSTEEPLQMVETRKDAPPAA
jgi:hypothetical protein